MSYKILITEDDKVTALLERQIVHNLGYEVTDVVEDANATLESIAKNKPDIILMDINLPGEMDGISTAGHINKAHGIPVIYITGNEDDSTMKRAIDSHSFGYILKPIRPEVLFTAIEMTMQRAQLEQQLKASESRLKLLNEKLEEKVAERTTELVQNNHQLEEEIVRRQEVELNLTESLAREKELNELKSRVVTMVSHELKTPLTTILSSIQLIAFHVDNRAPLEKIQSHTHVIERTVHELTNLINDTLFMSRIDAGKMKRNDVPVHFPSLINTILFPLKEGMGREYEFNIEIEKTIPETIWFDASLIKTVTTNLISNAIKYSPYEKKVEILVFYKSKQIKIDVIDHGIGIPEKDHEHLFKLFHRASNTTNIEGSGIGLSIVKRCMDMLGGSIIFTSIENEGSKFTMTFPVLENQPEK